MSLRVSKINIPERFRFLLEGSEYEAPVLAVAESVGTILYDNDLHSFSYYTDHGTNHVSEVLKSEVELIPTVYGKEVRPMFVHAYFATRTHQ